jgi:hypothetical protein
MFSSAFKYLFGSSPVPQPGSAYHMPLQQFQSYPANRPQGAGTLVGRPMRAEAKQWGIEILQQVAASGNGSGTTTGQVISQPLVITQIASGGNIQG